MLLTASLLFIGTGAGLMGFYRVHMLEVVSIEFLLVPLIMVVGGVATLLTALFGFYVTMREDSCLTITYAVSLSDALSSYAHGCPMLAFNEEERL